MSGSSLACLPTAKQHSGALAIALPTITPFWHVPVLAAFLLRFLSCYALDILQISMSSPAFNGL